MKQSEFVQHWLDSAKEDLEVCESLFEKKHYSWCLFIGHLVIEKTLKALWIKAHHPELHPRIHNLARLAKKIPVQLTDEQEKILLDVNNFYLSGRYPEDKLEFHKLCTPEYSQENFKQLRIFDNGS